MIRALRLHWPEYLCEATLLGLFMISASLCTAFLRLPQSPIVAHLSNASLQRASIGVAMGLTGLVLILSPMGKRSGGHFNPAVTVAFWSLGKIAGWDALFYVIAQFVGGVVGLAFVAGFGRPALADPSVNFVATLPGAAGVGVAFVAEFSISFLLMLTILNVGNRPRLARYTPWVASALVAIFITFEAPFSGMSMNPARTFSSAFVGQIWLGIWVYFTAPVLAMICAALAFRRGGGVVYCAKLHHHNGARCIFRCAFSELAAQEQGARLARASQSTTGV